MFESCLRNYRSPKFIRASFILYRHAPYASTMCSLRVVFCSMNFLEMYLR